MTQHEFEILFQNKIGLLTILREWYFSKKLYTLLHDLDNEIDRLKCARIIFNEYDNLTKHLV